MRIFYNFSPVIKISLWLMFAISLIVVIFAVLIISGVIIPLNITPGQATVALFFFSITTLVSLTFATIHYRFTDTHVRLNLLFLDILGGRIAIRNILNMVKKDNKLYISFLWTGEDPVIAEIAVHPKHFDKVRILLLSKNARIVYFDEDQQKQEEEQQD